jgi:membrane protein implicated in regulation of membrane protease activity
VAALGASVLVQLVVFIGVSIASLALIRPVAKAHLRTPARLRTGTAALVGARAVVIERVDDLGGRVRIGGEEWSARAFLEGQVIEPGTRVEVAEIEGATALVVE